MRQHHWLDTAILNIDNVLRTLFPPPQRPATRLNPADTIPPTTLNAEEQREVRGLMRVNHAGEVAAQALYQGQALTAKLNRIREQMIQAANEEIDHLAWCEARLQELDTHPSYFNVVWYTGAFFIGALAGIAGDQWSLGFVAETERQVSEHLERHLRRLPPHDSRSQAILTQMHRDEMKHASTAVQAGARELPWVFKRLMAIVSKVMTKTSYYC